MKPTTKRHLADARKWSRKIPSAPNENMKALLKRKTIASLLALTRGSQRVQLRRV